MKKTRISMIITALFFAIFAHFAISVLLMQISFLCGEVRALPGGGFEMTFTGFNSKATPMIIGLVIVALAALAVIARIVLCKKWIYFISIALIPASFVVFFVADLNVATHIYVRESIFSGLYISNMDLLGYFKYLFMALTVIPEAVQGVLFVKNGSLE